MTDETTWFRLVLMKTTNNAAATIINALIDIADLAAEKGNWSSAVNHVAEAYAQTTAGTELRIEVEDCANAIAEAAPYDIFEDFFHGVRVMRRAA